MEYFANAIPNWMKELVHFEVHIASQLEKCCLVAIKPKSKNDFTLVRVTLHICIIMHIRTDWVKLTGTYWVGIKMEDF